MGYVYKSKSKFCEQRFELGSEAVNDRHLSLQESELPLGPEQLLRGCKNLKVKMSELVVRWQGY